MPIVHRELDALDGALVDVMIGVGIARQRAHERLGMLPPPALAVKAQLDTGTHRSGVDLRVLLALGLEGPVDTESVYTSSTGDVPHLAPRYLISYTLVSSEGIRIIPEMFVLAHQFGPDEQIRATIGRDLLKTCYLQYFGAENRFVLAF